jgi:hypothetical protein
VWAFALAANTSLGSVNFFNDTISASNHEKTLRNRAILTNQLKDIEFEGVSGYIKFGEGQEVRTSIDIFR